MEEGVEREVVHPFVNFPHILHKLNVLRGVVMIVSYPIIMSLKIKVVLRSF